MALPPEWVAQSGAACAMLDLLGITGLTAMISNLITRYIDIK